MKIVIVDNYDEMSGRAASYVISQVLGKPDSILGLAAGNTPLGMYRELVKSYDRRELDFSETTLFNLDEYCNLDKDNPRSYSYFMKKNLISQINVKAENVFIPNGMAFDIEEECRNYERMIMEKGGIDLQILGIGQNGHIGFNEPGTDFEAETHLVQLKPSTVEANARYFNNRGEVPTTAISMGIKTIMKSRMLVLLASGEKKADAIKRAINDEISPNLPASILQLHPNVVFIIDNEAASML